MGRATREALAFVSGVSVAMHFLRRVAIADAEALGVPEALDRLITLEPASSESWLALGRIVRHLRATLEEQHNPHAVLLEELHSEIMAHADAAAAVRPNGG